MILYDLLLTYLLIGAVFGVVNYVVTWRAFHREGRRDELPGDLLERSVCRYALTWPSLAFWCVLLVLTILLFPKRHR